MSTKASPLAQLAPPRFQVFACYLTFLALPALIFGFTFSGRSKAPREVRITLYCALAFPPSQVERRVQLEAVYCKGLDVDKQCQADFGWIVVTKPVPCD